MWWCCGKTNLHSTGCHQKPHEKLVEEVQDSDDSTGLEKAKKIRCYVCREKGHSGLECPKEPNLRTSHHPLKEDSRILKNYRPKLTNSDADIVT